MSTDCVFVPEPKRLRVCFCDRTVFKIPAFHLTNQGPWAPRYSLRQLPHLIKKQNPDFQRTPDSYFSCGRTSPESSICLEYGRKFLEILCWSCGSIFLGRVLGELGVRMMCADASHPNPPPNDNLAGSTACALQSVLLFTQVLL